MLTIIQMASLNRGDLFFGNRFVAEFSLPLVPRVIGYDYSCLWPSLDDIIPPIVLSPAASQSNVGLGEVPTSPYL